MYMYICDVQVLPVAGGGPHDNECHCLPATAARGSSEQTAEEIHVQEGQREGDCLSVFSLYVPTVLFPQRQSFWNNFWGRRTGSDDEENPSPATAVRDCMLSVQCVVDTCTCMYTCTCVCSNQSISVVCVVQCL